MKFTIEKNIRILDELITYFNKQGNTEFHIDMKKEDEQHYFCISGFVEHLTQEEVKSLEEVLNMPRQHEIEEYYWQLGGEISFDNELTLVGMMIDKANVTYEDKILTISVIREE